METARRGEAVPRTIGDCDLLPVAQGFAIVAGLDPVVIPTDELVIILHDSITEEVVQHLRPLGYSPTAIPGVVVKKEEGGVPLPGGLCRRPMVAGLPRWSAGTWTTAVDVTILSR